MKTDWQILKMEQKQKCKQKGQKNKNTKNSINLLKLYNKKYKIYIQRKSRIENKKKIEKY